jgi:hypothetical protein
MVVMMKVHGGDVNCLWLIGIFTVVRNWVMDLWILNGEVI